MAVNELHISEFYRDTARILALLYQHFPRPITLYVEDIAGPDTPDEFGLHSPRHTACLEAMVWLSTSGFLRYASLVRQEALDRAVLTQRGFLSLTALTEPGGESYAAQLRRLAKEGNTLQIDAAVSAYLLASRQFE